MKTPTYLPLRIVYFEMNSRGINRTAEVSIEQPRYQSTRAATRSEQDKVEKEVDDKAGEVEDAVTGLHYFGLTPKVDHIIYYTCNILIFTTTYVAYVFQSASGNRVC